jgi:solute carrier family 6 amino acid transporter-like protein 5/7/9/14
MCSHFLIYSEYVLRQPDSIDDGIGDPDWRLVIGLFVFWLTIFLVVVRGVQSSGKVAYFLALFPYVVMIALLIRGVTLPGAGEGIRFFFEPQWEELLNPKVREWKIL